MESISQRFFRGTRVFTTCLEHFWHLGRMGYLFIVEMDGDDAIRAIMSDVCATLEVSVQQFRYIPIFSGIIFAFPSLKWTHH